MADENGAAQSAQTLPVPEFYFSVEISNVGKITCKEVSGLDAEFDVIEYRSGNTPGFTKIKMPCLHKSGDVTLSGLLLCRPSIGRHRQYGKASLCSHVYSLT